MNKSTRIMLIHRHETEQKEASLTTLMALIGADAGGEAEELFVKAVLKCCDMTDTSTLREEDCDKSIKHIIPIAEAFMKMNRSQALMLMSAVTYGISKAIEIQFDNPEAVASIKHEIDKEKYDDDESR